MTTICLCPYCEHIHEREIADKATENCSRCGLLYDIWPDGRTEINPLMLVYPERDIRVSYGSSDWRGPGLGRSGRPPIVFNPDAIQKKA